MSVKNIREDMKKYSIRPTKSLGQNFLADEGVVGKIVEGALVEKGDLVIEIGPGLGGMTALLAERAGRVAAVEIDRRLMPVLEDRLSEYDNAVLLNEDILELDIKSRIIGPWSGGLNGTVKIIGNLPYYITTPIIMKLLEEDPGIGLMVFMVQKEVAERMAAKPGSKKYGALSVAVQYYSTPEIFMTVPPDCFIPQPEVDSAVVRMEVYKVPPVTLQSREAFFKIVKAAFGQRRKTLVNALSNSGYFTADKGQILAELVNVGLGENQRGETLSIMQFAQLANAFWQKNLLKIY